MPDLVAQARKRKVHQTYGFVQKSWMSFYDPTNELLNKIHTHFYYKLGVELQNPLPKDTYKRFDPDSLLTELAEVVKANEVQDPRLMAPSLVFDAPIQAGPDPEPHTHGTGRSSLFGEVAVSLGREIFHAARKTIKPKAHEARFSRSSSSSEESWRKKQNLENDIKDFRKNSLDGLSLRDEKYVKLREEHIKPTVQGYQPKVKRS